MNLTSKLEQFSRLKHWGDWKDVATDVATNASHWMMEMDEFVKFCTKVTTFVSQIVHTFKHFPLVRALNRAAFSACEPQTSDLILGRIQAHLESTQPEEQHRFQSGCRVEEHLVTWLFPTGSVKQYDFRFFKIYNGITSSKCLQMMSAIHRSQYVVVCDKAEFWSFGFPTPFSKWEWHWKVFGQSKCKPSSEMCLRHHSNLANYFSLLPDHRWLKPVLHCKFPQAPMYIGSTFLHVACAWNNLPNQLGIPGWRLIIQLSYAFVQWAGAAQNYEFWKQHIHEFPHYCSQWAYRGWIKFSACALEQLGPKA